VELTDFVATQDPAGSLFAMNAGCFEREVSRGSRHPRPFVLGRLLVCIELHFTRAMRAILSWCPASELES
jgi:hypothetical protein